MKKLIFIITILLITLTSFNSDEDLFYLNYAKTKVEEYNPSKTKYVIVVDYTKSILSERLYLLDMSKGKVVMSTRVSHAFNSGILYASEYSNVSGSNTSSKGVFLTSNTYISQKWGYAMNVIGLDKGINDRALPRRIVFHSDKNMKALWSYGCFATPEDINKKLINLTKNGTLVCVITD